MAHNRFRYPVANAVARWGVLPLLHRRRVHRFLQQCQSARRVQRQVLGRILRQGAQSAYGYDHGLADIRSLADFRRRIPIAGYDYAAPYIDRVATGETTALFPAGEEILAFVQTSATTGRPKVFPANRSWFQAYQRGWDVWGVQAFSDHPALFGLPIVQLAGAWRMGTTPGGHTITVSSALIERFQSPFIRRHYALPPEIARIRNLDARGYAAARFAAAGPVGFLSTVTPAWFLRLADNLRQHAPTLIRDLADGTIDRRFDIEPDLRARLEWLARRPQPQRAQVLAQALQRRGELRARDVWRPQLLSCWLGGTVGHAARGLAAEFGDVPVRDQGLLSSEGRHTVPLHDGVPHGPLSIDANYYEFLPAHEPGGDPLEAHELTVGADYRLIFSTLSGLYRYDIGDIVRCVGWQGEAPVLEFLQKAAGYCDLEGEKLSSHTVCEAVTWAGHRLGHDLACYTWAPLRRPGQPPRYALVVEASALPRPAAGRELVRLIDQRLQEQVLVYGTARASRILGSPLLVRLSDGEWRRRQERAARAQQASELQFKHPPLVSDLAFLDGLNVLDESDSAQAGSIEPGSIEPGSVETGSAGLSSAGSESTPSRARAA